MAQGGPSHENKLSEMIERLWVQGLGVPAAMTSTPRWTPLHMRCGLRALPPATCPLATARPEVPHMGTLVSRLM